MVAGSTARRVVCRHFRTRRLALVSVGSRAPVAAGRRSLEVTPATLPIVSRLGISSRFFLVPIEGSLRRTLLSLRQRTTGWRGGFAGVRLGIRDSNLNPFQSTPPSSPHLGSIRPNASRVLSGPMRYPGGSIRIDTTTLEASRSSSDGTAAPPHLDRPHDCGSHNTCLRMCRTAARWRPGSHRP